MAVLQVALCLLFALFLRTCIQAKITQEFIQLTHENGIQHSDAKDGLEVYCYKGEQYNLFTCWRSVYVELKSPKSDYTIFVGNSVSEVNEQYNKHAASWIVLFHWQKSAVNLPAFTTSCLGISSNEPYTIELVVRYVNYWRILVLGLGIFMFYAAPRLSRNVVFHYATGVSIGVLASLLVILFLIYRAVPKKTTGVALLTLGTSFVVYVFQLIWDNAQSLLRTYSTFVAAYIITAAVISFVICYRYGPVSEIRTLNLIQWMLQAVAIIMIYLSSEAREVTMAINIIVITVYIFPGKWANKLRMYWFRHFPPKIKLLTEEEYLNQASIETRKSLEELRKYCNSPECNTWKLIRRLKDPQRFASFIEGDSHLTDEEILTYDSESCLQLPGDEEDSDYSD